MKTNTLYARSATTAIVAALALGSTALAAQAVTPAADPPIVQPQSAPATAPVVIVPDTQTAPTQAPAQAPATTTSPPVLVSPVAVPQTTVVQTPTVQSETAPPPATEAASSQRQAAAPTRDTASSTPAPRAATNTNEANTADTAASAPLSEEQTAFIPAVPAPVAAAPAVPAASVADADAPAGQTANEVALLTGIFFIVLLLGLGAFTYVYWRRRSSAPAVPTVVRPKVDPKPEANGEARTALTLEAASEIAREHPDAPRSLDNNVANVAPIRTAPAKQASYESAPVALPSTIPDEFEQREALIKQMVEAKPDKANPFRSRKARQRRARLILQSLARKFEGREPWIDLSQYANNWPSMARRRASLA